MYKLNNEYVFSKTSFNHAKKRDMYIEYFKYTSKKDNEELGHTVFVSHESYSDNDGGIYFKVKEYENDEFVAVLNVYYLDDTHKDGIDKYFEHNPEMKVIKGEKQLRKFVDAIYKVFQES